MYCQNSRVKTPALNRPQQQQQQHFSDSFYDYPPHPPQNNNYYGQTIGRGHQLQQNYYGQTRGHQQQQHRAPQLRDRPNTSRNNSHNFNQFSQHHQQEKERVNPNHEDHKLYLCPGCSLHFDFLNRNNRFIGRVPLILNCQHTVCQDCIFKGAAVNHIICPTCKSLSELPNKDFNGDLQVVFTPNFYLLGVIMWCKPQQGSNFKQISLVPSQITLNNKKLVLTEQAAAANPLEPEGERCCFLSCCKRAVLRCQDCNDVYCVECCTAVHKSAKSLWSHVQVQITNSKFSTELEKCPEHRTMDIEFYCNTCDTGACCYCFIEKHEGHEREYLSKLDSDELKQFHIQKEKAEHVLRQLIISQKKLKDMCSSGYSFLNKKICKYFADMHGHLCLIQKKLLKELSEGGSEEASDSDNNITDLNSSLENSIKTWKKVLTAAENMNAKKINLRRILEKLKEVELTPCYLVRETDGAPNWTEFFPDPVLENLDELFTIKKSVSSSIRLLSENELPPDFVKDPTDTQYDSDIESCISSCLSSMRKEESNIYNKRLSLQQVQPNRRNSEQLRRKRVDKKFITDNEMVEVTHIESLECFYVQLKKHQAIFIQMNKDIENYVKMGANKVTSPQLNELYLALYATKSEKMWCRARLIEIKPQENTEMYEVYFIDFGSTQTVDINKLKELTTHLAQKKPFAIQCDLYNPAYTAWNKNAHVYMGKVINGKEIYMVVKNVNNGVYQVDLMVSSSDRGLTSIIDILIHTCSNALSSSSDSLSSVTRKDSYVPECKIFSNSFKFKKNQSERVIIANVVDPHNVFIHIAGYVDMFRSMVSEMKQYYKDKRTENCIPIEGTYVVVEYKDPVRGNWHRAFVKKVDIFQGKAQVLLVDWGNVVLVPLSSIRMLTENFTRLENQAILVKLAHVEPYRGEQAWSDRAIFFLQKNLRTQDPLKMTVNNVDPLEVALFETVGIMNICINAQLVLEKLADSTGKISQTVEWPDCDQEQPCFEEEEGIVEALLKKVDESPDEDSQSEQEEAKAFVKKQIDIVKVESPDLIYIKFIHLVKQEENLHVELQIHYNKDRAAKDTWKENEVCVVQMLDYYVRGKVICQVEGDKYKVNLYDKPSEVILPKEKLFIYSDYFKKFPSIVYKCHLANIRPAGGEKWSLSSIEALERIFNKHKEIFATKISEDSPKKNSIPMLMWYTHTKVGGALEPTVMKYISVNKLLVKLGFAYKETSKANNSSNVEEKTESNDAKLEETVDAEAGTSKLDESMESAGSGSDVIKEKSSAKGNVTSSSSDWNDLIEEEQKASASKQDSPYHTRETEITDWTPAFPIKKHKFNAWITCAETNGILYLRDEDLQPVYKDMETNLKQYFDEQPPILENPNWQPGQICTISYKDYWYRGKILKVNSPTEIVALMIDFGSDHTLSPKQLYREILYPEIPAFASKIKLDRIYPKSGDWISSDYDTLLDVVTEFAKIVIKGPLDVEIPVAEVYNDKGQNINEMLVKMCPNLTRHIADDLEKSDEDLALIEEEDTLNFEKDLENQIDTTSMDFKVESLPKEGFKDKILMHVVGVLSYNKVVLKQIEENYEKLVSLNIDIQESITTQPDLEDINVGMPCICPYAEDGLWYRARVHNIEGRDCGYVFVFFVDFGNVESVSTNNIKMMKPSWFDMPVSCYIANINIELKTDNHLEHVLQHMKKLFTKNKLVHFVSEDPLTVNLYENNDELCYQSLVNNGLLKIK